MTIDRNHEYLQSLVRELCKLPAETEWSEFKSNNEMPEMIGEYISALSNSAAFHGKVNAYLVWGVEDTTHAVIGTAFDWRTAKHNGQPLENWLLQLLSPKVDFRFYSVDMDGKPVVLLEICAASRHPIQFRHVEYIRVGSVKKKLKEFPEKERELWRIFDRKPFEQEIAAEHLSADEVLQLLDYPAYFDLLKLPLPANRDGILSVFAEDGLILKEDSGQWGIYNLGAILFARKLQDFRTLKRKTVRIVLYKGNNKFETIREHESAKGYATGFDGLIQLLLAMLPSNEVIEKALRKTLPMFPELAVRELVTNALLHQDFSITGTGPMIEIFDNRMEITNPGLPLVSTERFLDSPPKSRNEGLASLMRRIGVCEERGSGIDKVVLQTEIFQLPAPVFEKTEEHTRVLLFAHKILGEMDKSERIRACYMHACLRYVLRDPMTNTSLRDRFGIEEKDRPRISRIIKETLESGWIVKMDESVGTKSLSYLPRWAL